MSDHENATDEPDEFWTVEITLDTVEDRDRVLGAVTELAYQMGEIGTVSSYYHGPETEVPNARTRRAMREFEDGRGARFSTPDELWQELTVREPIDDLFDAIEENLRKSIVLLERLQEELQAKDGSE